MEKLWSKVYKYGENGLTIETVDEILNIIGKRIPQKELIKTIEIDGEIKQYKACPMCETQVDFSGLGRRNFCYMCG